MNMAIAYNMKKRGKKCEMAEGGDIKGVHKKSYSSGNPAHAEESDLGNAVRTQPSFAKSPKTETGRKIQDAPRQQVRDVIAENRAINPKLKGLSEGGDVIPEEGQGEKDGYESKSSHDLSELKHFEKHDDDTYPEHGAETDSHEMDMVDYIMAKRMSRGGEVANDTPPIADGKEADYDYLAKHDDMEFNYTGKNSGDEIGNEQEDDDRHDMVDRIMLKRMRERNPRPA
jgi:hypothetical protein